MTISLNVGDRVGQFQVIGPIVTRGGKRSFSMCRCECGKEWMANRASIREGRIISCGCVGLRRRTAANTTHGQSPRGPRSPEYSSWAAMIQRCDNVNSPAYSYYGARGITVCSAWRSFETFYRDMGKAPHGMEIERIDNAVGYEPGNCRWATRHEQMRNTRMTKMVTVRGETMCATDAAAKLGVPAGRIFWRVHKYGMTHQEAVDQIVGATAA